MSIALGSNSNNQIERSGFVHGGMSSFVSSSIYDSSDSGRPVAGLFADDLRFPETMKKVAVQQERDEEEEEDSCSSSSIGRNSDVSGDSSAGEGDSGESEVQSSYKGTFDSLDALEEVLPIKRGISKFYCGKSKSFTSLGDASSCSSITDIAKPENAFTRKRKNLLAFNSYFDNNCNNNGLRNNGGAISKRPANSRSTLALAVTMGSSESIENSESSNSSCSSPTWCLPPLHPHSRRLPNSESVASSPTHKYSPWRSFSLSDLQGAAATTTRIVCSVTSNGDDEDNPC